MCAKILKPAVFNSLKCCSDRRFLGILKGRIQLLRNGEILYMKIVLLFLLLTVLWPVQVLAAQTIFEHRERTYLSRAVVHEVSRQVTTSGFLDVHTLTIPLHDPYITIAPIESRRELGLRETTTNLLSQAGAIAGTNADFFGMTGTHSLAFGPVIANGQLMSITQSYNRYSNEFATFFLDENNFPIIQYIRPRIWFALNGVEILNVYSVNKVNNIDRPVIITTNGMINTAPLSARFPNAWKVVVNDGVVASVTNQPIFVPQNGFVVVMNHYYFARFNPHFWVGMNAEFDVFTDLGRDLATIQAAVGGGGMILQHGHTVHDSGLVVSGRHPRTALGITGDWQNLVLMTVDGRGHSIGATHEEMANLLRARGVTNAMHLDGGGSTTMAAQLDGRGTGVRVVNRVSDGSQRAVMNAIGVFDHSTPGPTQQLVLTQSERYIPLGHTIPLSVHGLDLYRHRTWVNPEQVMFSAYTIGAEGLFWPSTGTWHGSTYVPDQAGMLYIRAQYGDITANQIFLVHEPFGPYFRDPIRTPMTTVIPGYAFDFSVPLPGSGSLAYSIRQEGPAAILQMSAVDGGIFATDRNQWRFINEINAMAPNFVIIRMDINPLNIPSRDERELFHQALRTQQEMGRMVFVLSNVEYSPTLTLRDGIRYIDLGNAGTDSAVFFRVIERQIWYDF